MTDPDRRQVRVRRSPRIGVFLLLGAVLGAVVAAVAVLAAPPDPTTPTEQTLGFFVLLLAPAGALLGGLVAGMLSDFVGRKPVLASSDVIFIGGAIGQAVCHTVWAMVSQASPPRLLSFLCACSANSSRR